MLKIVTLRQLTHQPDIMGYDENIHKYIKVSETCFTYSQVTGEFRFPSGFLSFCLLKQIVDIFLIKLVHFSITMAGLVLVIC